MTSDLPIVFERFSVHRGGTAMLSGVELTIGAGPPTVLIGPNGSGKTTVLRAAMGLVRASSGTLTWAGRSASPPVRRALVFQRPVMLRRSVEDNLHYALATAGVARAGRAARAGALLELVGLAGFGPRPARHLSGGERQRLAFARALARDPEVLLLDEPTASLDPAATQAIEDLVRTVSARGVKVVLATHDLGEASRLAGDIVLLHRGEVVEHAPADRMLAHPATEAARRFFAGQLLL